MKKLILFLVTAFLLSSCTVVRFENPQPGTAPALTEFPEKIHGLFVSDSDDTLNIGKDFFRFTDGDEVNLQAELSSSNAVLKKLNNTYILSLKDDLGWDVYPLKISRNKVIAQHAIMDADSEQLINDLKRTSSVIEIRNEEGKFDHYLIDPSDEEFKMLLKKKLFSEKIIFRKLK